MSIGCKAHAWSLNGSTSAWAAAGAMVDENVQIAQKNLLIVTVDGQPNALQVWPSPANDATYLVSRIDSLTRVAAP